MTLLSANRILDDMALPDRVAYSPGEFAKMFGKSQTWGYRQIYQGKVKTITEHGRILIPAKEIERMLESAGIYNGMEKPMKARVADAKLTPEQKGIWGRYLELRRQTNGSGTAPKQGSLVKEGKNGSVKAKIARLWSGKN